MNVIMEAASLALLIYIRNDKYQRVGSETIVLLLALILMAFLLEIISQSSKENDRTISKTISLILSALVLAACIILAGFCWLLSGPPPQM